MSSPTAPEAPPVQSGAMTDTRLWDRAAALPSASDGRRLPAVAALPPGMPTVGRAVRLHARRRAPLRDAADAHPRARRDDAAARSATQIDVMLRHPGDAKVTTSRPGDDGGGRLRDLDLRRRDRPDVRRRRTSSARSGRSATARAASHDPDFPGMSLVYEPVTALPMETLPGDVHPPGRATARTCSRPGRCCVIGADSSVDGREAIFLDCDHPRTIEIAGDRPDHRDRHRGRSRDRA